ncbi:MAG TPA: YceD family protein [Burkholderiaceae bacterium]|nr:YceD family protein [Burkholderiaceae bacterium]
MNPREFDPLRLDVAAFAKADGRLDGHWPVAEFGRLAASAAAGAELPGEVRWAARGEARAVRGDAPQVWLHLTASTHVPLQCQRCLEPVGVAVEVKRSFRFVHGEDDAAALDAESDDDVLALTRALDLRELLEDELLLALPLVPRHAVCPVPLAPPASADAGEPEEAAPHPFASLAALKRPRLN